MMRQIYSVFIWIFSQILPLLARFSPKLKAFKHQRNAIFKDYKRIAGENNRMLWVHAASLGEYEQGVPVMEALKKSFPEHKILLTFFSPSGYDQKKNNPIAAHTTYLPLDTQGHAKRFIEMIKPEMAFFIKYEFWPNYLHYLADHSIPTYLISGVFRENQLFFKPYGSWMKKSLKAFDHFFVQDQQSLENANKLGFSNATVSGDTRFDRVSKQLKMDNKLAILDDFKANMPLLVCGSTWPEDENLLIDFINTTGSGKIKIVVAPHQINIEKIQRFAEKLTVNVALFTERSKQNLTTCDVLILDTIGLLGRAYSYADVAYVGGAAGTTGLHNILEPATFSLPIITGPNIEKFPEAKQLRRLAGLFVVSTTEETTSLLEKFFANDDFRLQTGMICGHFVQEKTGATKTIIEHIVSKR